jgi:hypothetical protein
MKKCNVCNLLKPLVLFSTNGKTPNGTQKYHPLCKQCNNEKRKHNSDIKQTVIAKKCGMKCKVCGYNKCKDALELHHIDPNTKEHNVSSLTRNFSSIEKLEKELDKCIMLCSNCHREFHAGLINLNI